MKKIVLLFFCCLAGVRTICQNLPAAVAIIPEPVLLVQNTGTFILPAAISIALPDVPALKQTAELLQQRLTKATGYTVVTSNNIPTATIKLLLNKTTNEAIGKEGYQLTVRDSNITISANQAAGLFYGVQTLLQLLPKEIESNVAVQQVKWQMPCVSITDYPRFGWRGLMFDVSRHFFSKKEVMDFIDQMARYKYNLLHWHLTDDEGWRVEIKGLPKLTEVGAWNVKKTGYFGTFSPPTADEPRDNGGFYTQEDIKEVVQYAKDRFINVLPEIDVPGHSLAAITAYPELSCSNGADNHGVSSGEKIKDWATHTALADDNLCPANENVYVFLDKVFGELVTLFPFEYIHIGGDETFKTYWQKSDAVKALMKKEKLKNMEEVQSYFGKRVEKIVEAKGKKVIGWDEILEGGLAPNAAVMSWRGEKGGIEAARLKHEVVMTPASFVYLDYMQADVITEPRVYSSLRLNKAYQFEPVPPGTDAKYIKGGQANIWTEQIPNTRHLQYMAWPRAFAIAEVLWSPKEKKNWSSFVTKVEQHFKRYDVLEIKYSPAMYDPEFIAKNSNGQLQIELKNEVEGLDIYYSFDNSFPDRFYPKYTAALTPPKDAVMLKLITYRGNQPVGRMIAMPLDEMKKRAGIKK